MKKFILSLGAVIALTACGGGGTEEPAPAEDVVEDANQPAEDAADQTEGAVDEAEDAVEGGDDAVEEEGAVEEDGEAAAGVDVAAAEEVYQQSCLHCHGGNLEGAMGPALTGTGLSSDEVLEILEKGQGVMPPQNLPADDAQNLAHWIAEQ